MIPPELLERWPGRWRYPDLVVSLSRDQASDRMPLRDALLRGYAHPRTDGEGAYELLARGEFALVEAFLSEYGGRSPNADVEALEQELHAQRGHARRTVQARALALKARANEAGVDLDLPADVSSLAERCLPDAHAFLDEAEARVSGAEAQRAEEIVRKLERLVTDRSQDDLTRAAIERCIERKQFGAARTLLAAGTALGGETSHGRGVRRRPRLPWHLPPRDLLGWFLDPAGTSPPPGFFAEWLPAEDDQSATSMIEALASLVDTRPDNREAVSNFARALDDICDGEETHEYSAESAESGAMTSLYAFSHEYLRALAPFAVQPVSLLVTADPSTAAETERAAIVFSVGEAPPGRPPAPVITVEDLLGLIGDRQNRRLHLLRAIGRQLDWASALSGHAATRAPDISDPAELARYVAWLLDVLNADAEAGFGEVLVHLAGVDPRVALQLLHEILSGAAASQSMLSLAQLTRIASSAGFLAKARKILLEALSPPARAAIGAIGTLSDSEGRASISDVEELLAVVLDPPLEAKETREGLQELVERGHIQMADGQVQVRPALVSLITAAIGDLEGLIEGA